MLFTYVYLFSEPDILVLDSPESCSKTRPAQLMAATVTAIPDRFGAYCVMKLNVQCCFCLTFRLVFCLGYMFKLLCTLVLV